MSFSEGIIGNLSIITLLILLVLGIFGLVIYFIPTIVAVKRNHVNKVPIILVNIFFGWSLIGWVLSLVWACSSSNSKTVIMKNPYQQANNPYPPVNNPYPPVNHPYPPVNNPYQPMNDQYSPANSTNQPVNNNPYPPAGNSETVTAKLQELSKLRADGVISEDEFQAKRAEILSRF